MATTQGSYDSRSAGFKLAKKYHMDSRIEYDTLDEMVKVKDVQMPEMLLGFCIEDHGVYLYNKANEKDETLGKWRKFEPEVADKAYEHQQVKSIKKWNIQHDLGIQYPKVIAFDQDGNEAIGEIDYVSDVKLTLTFCKAISGVAYVRG